MAEAIYTSRVLASPWGRREMFYNASSSDESASIQDDADAQLWAARPRLSFSGAIQETPTFRYGVEFSLGTLLTADTRGFSFDCRLSSIHVTLNNDGMGGRNGKVVVADLILEESHEYPQLSL